MFDEIKKRDGRIVAFKKCRIQNAIKKAGCATGEFGCKVAGELADLVTKLASVFIEDKIPTVEQIQDVVEDVLLSSEYRKTAKAYIIYRDQHAKMRDIAKRSDVDLVDSYLEKIDWQVNENSNMTYSLQGLHNHLASELSKIYWINKLYPKEIRESHESGDIHLHDLNCLSSYCVGWDLHDLLMSGFTGVSGKLHCKPPKHLGTALGQIVNFFYTLQGESAGAQAFSNFDTLLAPFIRYDNLSYEEVKQALQEFLFNNNVPTRVGFQTPFTNITMDLIVPKIFADQQVVIGGELKEETYKEFQKEVDMINKAFCEVMLAGDAQGQLFTFPIPTYNITKDFDWDNPNLDLLWEMTAKYGIPYFSNFVNSSMNPEDARSMCCRLRLETKDLAVRGGALFGAHPLTGSIGVVTINLPRIGYQAANEKEFFELLEKHMDVARNSLEIKRKVVEQFTDKGLYPYTKFYLRKIKEANGRYWANHFSTIGLIGMNEAVLNLIGKNVGSKEGIEFANKVLEFMRSKLKEYQLETGNNYNLEATPAEGTCYRLAQKDKARFKDIICANQAEFEAGAEPFYTNSSQLPVNFTDDLFEVLDLQDDMQTKYTGGTVVHLFLGEQVRDISTVKNMVKKVCENYKLPYFTLTPTFSVCPSHGYLKGEHHTCGQCGQTCEVFSRVVGYIRPISQWNKGKKAEFPMRKTGTIA
ncbi:MAG: Anaerobic ribonucleoside-triphosphate reductase [candidate division TM6 bacterium GW2011_GWF2_32_72]|nr:MAG: Anaerobic ribonucleoside-triphosphate reductase [candidate division TM6 bacterium GW2011_GWF2_32_72]